MLPAPIPNPSSNEPRPRVQEQAQGQGPKPKTKDPRAKSFEKAMAHSQTRAPYRGLGSESD